MEFNGIKLLFDKAAFKQGFTKADAASAFQTLMYDSEFAGTRMQGSYLLIGFSSDLQLMEIMYWKINANMVQVFHMMKCRKQFRKYVGL
jgi:hypothetical protein